MMVVMVLLHQDDLIESIWQDGGIPAIFFFEFDGNCLGFGVDGYDFAQASFFDMEVLDEGFDDIANLERHLFLFFDIRNELFFIESRIADHAVFRGVESDGIGFAVFVDGIDDAYVSFERAFAFHQDPYEVSDFVFHTHIGYFNSSFLPTRRKGRYDF